MHERATEAPEHVTKLALTPLQREQMEPLRKYPLAVLQLRATDPLEQVTHPARVLQRVQFQLSRKYDVVQLVALVRELQVVHPEATPEHKAHALLAAK